MLGIRRAVEVTVEKVEAYKNLVGYVHSLAVEEKGLGSSNQCLSKKDS